VTWRTHAVGGVAALWLLAPVPNTLPGPSLVGPSVGLLATAAALGALLPDLDAQDAKARHLSVGGFQPLEPLGDLLHAAFGHRGLLHSLPGLALFALLLALPLSAWWGTGPSIAICLGYASHLALDSCTIRGIPLLPTRSQARRGQDRRNQDHRGKDAKWSFVRRFHLLPSWLRVSTGTPSEDPVFFLLALAAMLLLLRTLTGTNT
jgi:inner membrane protein